MEDGVLSFWRMLTGSSNDAFLTKITEGSDHAAASDGEWIKKAEKPVDFFSLFIRMKMYGVLDD